MIEIRPIQEHESPAFLDLLCTVFELDNGRAGTVFYSEPFFDIRRKWALFLDGQMASILTTTPLHFGFGNAIGIAGVGTLIEHRGKGLGQKLLEVVLEEADKNNEGAAILFAHNEVLYQRCGFTTLDEVIKGNINAPCALPHQPALPLAQVQEKYANWATSHPMRLNRDDRRWKYWNFVFRECYSAPGGYIASETTICREAIITDQPAQWPLLNNSEWYGLRSMTQMLGVPLINEQHHLLLMGRNFPDIPQMFMSDQF